MEGYVGEDGAEVVVEETFEDVQADVGQAGVDVGVDGQNYSVRPDHATCDDVTLATEREGGIELFDATQQKSEMSTS